MPAAKIRTGLIDSRGYTSSAGADCERGPSAPGKSRSRGRFWPNGWRSERRTNHETEAGSLLIAERVGKRAQEEGGDGPDEETTPGGDQFRPANNKPVATPAPNTILPPAW